MKAYKCDYCLKPYREGKFGGWQNVRLHDLDFGNICSSQCVPRAIKKHKTKAGCAICKCGH